MSTLYRDYRPSTFSEVFGQNHIKIALQNEIANLKQAHAYLFCGPRAVGKTTIARVLAKALNCENITAGQSEPCNKCATCVSINQGACLDVIEIDAASNTGVDNVRENVIASARVTGSGHRTRVFIIDEVHMLSISAWNALLKTLEEPPKNVVFILCTTEIHKVPGTIISRCERFDFKRISVSDIVTKLQHIVSQEKANVDLEVLEAIARQADGHLRDAESLLGQVFALGSGLIDWNTAELIIPKRHHNEIISLLEFVSKKDASQAIKLVNELVDSGLNLKNFIGEMLTVLRKMLLNKANPGLAESLGLDLGNSLEMKISSLAANLSLEKISLYLQSFLDVYSSLATAFIVQLPLEMKIVELCLGAEAQSFSSFKKGDNRSINDVVSPPSVTKTTKTETLLVSDKIIESKEDLISPLQSAVNSAPNSDLKNISLTEVKNKWPDFLACLRERNHSLSFILQNCQFSEIINSHIILTFKYKFHKDRVSDAAIKDLVERTMADIFGMTLLVEARIDEALNLDLVGESNSEIQKVGDGKSEGESNNLLNNLLQNFGGELVG